MQGTGVLFFLPLAVSKLVSIEENVPVEDGRIVRIRRAYETLGPEFEKLESRHLRPLIAQNPEAVEKYIGENYELFLEDVSELIVKMISEQGGQLVADVMSLMGSHSWAEYVRSSVFSQRIVDTLKESIELDVDNSLYIMQRFGQLMFTPDFASIAESSGMDIDEFLTATGRFYLSLFALMYGIGTEDRRNEPVLSMLAKLSLRYGEERDSMLTTFDYVLDAEKHASLDESYREYEKVVNSPA